MKNIKMIATDLDGTLFTDDKKISAGNLKAISEAVKAGVHFVPATGRALYTMPQDMKELEYADYAVTSNGAAVIDMKSRKPIYKKQIDLETARSVLSHAAKIGIMAEIFVDGRAYTLEKYMNDLVGYGVNPRFVKWYTDTRIVVDKYDNILKKDTTVENINMIFTDNDVRVETYKYLTEYENVEVTNSIGNNLEAGAKGCSKGEAVAFLAERLGITMDNVMCLGDNYNDMDMIKRAGIGIAVANGEDNIKSAADYVAKSNNDDGFAEAVYKFVLNRRE